MINELNTIKLKPFQDDFIFYDTPGEQCFPCIESGWGTGKSLSAILKGLIHSQESPNNLGLICRKETTDLRDSTMKDFELYTDTNINVQSKSVKIYGSEIIFRHAKDMDTAVVQNLNLGWFWIEQADEMLTDKIFWLLHGRLRRNVKRRGGWITANSGCGWIKRLYPLTGKQDNHIHIKNKRFPLYRACSWDNADNLPKDTLHNFKELEKHKPEMYKQFVLNSRDIMTGAVWPNFDPKYHVIPQIQIPREWKRYRLWDMATAGVVVCLWMAVDMSGNLIFYKEYYDKGKAPSLHAEAVNRLNGSDNTLIDYSCHYAFNDSQADRMTGKLHTLADEYRKDGITLHPAVNAKDEGAARVSELMIVDMEKLHPFYTGLQGSPRIFITKNCIHTIEQVENYRRVTKESDTAHNVKYVDIDMHCCDCVRYGAMSRPKAPKRKLKVTYDEFGRPNIGVYLDAAMEERELEEAYR